MGNVNQIVLFKLGDIQFGFPIEQIKEIIRHINPIKVPKTPDYLQGIISLRDKAYAMIDLRLFLGLEKREADKDVKIIIANNWQIGFIVDDVTMITTVQEGDMVGIEKLPTYINQAYIQYILQTDGVFTIVLNMKEVIGSGSCDLVCA